MDSHCFIKYFLFSMNVIVWIISLLFIGVGSWAHHEKTKYNTMGSVTADPSVFLIVVGVFMFLLTFCGCVGALRENRLLLKIYMFVLGLLFLLEIITGFLAFFFVEETRSKVSAAVKHVIINYRDDPDLQNAIDGIQTGLKCCGGYSYHDWNHNKYYNCSAHSVEACGVPFSCCVKDEINSQCGFGVRRTMTSQEASAYINTQGCIDRLSDWIVNNLHIVGGLAFGFAVFQLFGILGASTMIKDIEQAIAINDKLHADAHHDYLYRSPVIN